MNYIASSSSREEQSMISVVTEVKLSICLGTCSLGHTLTSMIKFSSELNSQSSFASITYFLLCRIASIFSFFSLMMACCCRSFTLISIISAAGGSGYKFTSIVDRLDEIVLVLNCLRSKIKSMQSGYDESVSNIQRCTDRQRQHYQHL